MSDYKPQPVTLRCCMLSLLYTAQLGLCPLFIELFDSGSVQTCAMVLVKNKAAPN